MHDHPVAIIDLDNCISDEKWREHLCEMHHPNPNDRYWNYHAACGGDQPANIELVNALARNHFIFIFTSRPEVARTDTVLWLHKHRIPYMKLCMRSNTSIETSVEVKRKMLLAIPEGFKAFCAIDDRQDILDMYASYGIFTRRVFIHEPEINHS